MPGSIARRRAARIEVPLADVVRLAEPATRLSLSRRLRELGFRFVTLDLEGFRSGSMNDLLSIDIRAQYERPANYSALPEVPS